MFAESEPSARSLLLIESYLYLWRRVHCSYLNLNLICKNTQWCQIGEQHQIELRSSERVYGSVFCTVKRRDSTSASLKLCLLPKWMCYAGRQIVLAINISCIISRHQGCCLWEGICCGSCNGVQASAASPSEQEKSAAQIQIATEQCQKQSTTSQALLSPPPSPEPESIEKRNKISIRTNGYFFWAVKRLEDSSSALVTALPITVMSGTCWCTVSASECTIGSPYVRPQRARQSLNGDKEQLQMQQWCLPSNQRPSWC